MTMHQQLSSRLSSRITGVAAGLASVVGAGLIGVPAAVISETGSAAILTWIVAALACVPMLCLFRDTVVSRPESRDPLRDTVRSGLGRTAGDMVPLLFGIVVLVGLPAGSVMAARNLSAITGSALPESVTAIAILAVAVATNLLGKHVGHQVERIGTVALILSLAGVVVWSTLHSQRVPEIFPDGGDVLLVPVGFMVAFWAFIGFENLTFLARDLPDPKREFMPIALTSLGLLLLLTTSLTVAVLVLTPRADPVTGVVDALRTTPYGDAAALVLAASGAVGMLLNSVAWVRGVGLVIDSAARDGILPHSVAGRDALNPRRAITIMSCGFAISLVLLQQKPTLVIDMLAAASGVFIVIYTLCILAYVRAFGLRVSTVANLALVPFLLWSLASSGWRAAFPLAAVLIAWVIVRVGVRRTSVPEMHEARLP
ncbi:amino acid permease [Brevibacterium sp. RIT 803]|uniref:APC family permease n=1 Tax=Brevibacterium sp. RIT 803 TaxID=2810210 RepID=UPI001950EB47|nr:amino acid permease [Brevibacterium sp. RIT 803]MBM6588733.1 amino acid permease [Brevibacterium sp. RIT 803]